MQKKKALLNLMNSESNTQEGGDAMPAPVSEHTESEGSSEDFTSIDQYANQELEEIHENLKQFKLRLTQN